ncbi:histidine phosphatase family protein [Nonomuraea sp. NPDC049480]|uniref:histidine phosphatase family protein n=1 Tax=Nonomuraea sp. NPDC049480 TaxID=3364353 RepID=UPI003788FB95
MGERTGGAPFRPDELSGVLFVRHATTAAMRAACFPAGDEDADAASLARAAAVLAPPTGSWAAGAGVADVAVAGDSVAGDSVAGDSVAGAGAVAWVAPAAAARQTAAAAGLVAGVVPALAEADCGRWRGLPYEQVAREEPDALARWLADPHAAPHGGESLADLAARVASWLDSVCAQDEAVGVAPQRAPGRGGPKAVVVCDVGVIRAALGHALGLEPSRTARFDLAPLSVTELTATRDGWRVAHVNRKVLF